MTKAAKISNQCKIQKNKTHKKLNDGSSARKKRVTPECVDSRKLVTVISHFVLARRKVTLCVSIIVGVCVPLFSPLPPFPTYHYHWELV